MLGVHWRWLHCLLHTSFDWRPTWGITARKSNPQFPLWTSVSMGARSQVNSTMMRAQQIHAIPLIPHQGPLRNDESNAFLRRFPLESRACVSPIQEDFPGAPSVRECPILKPKPQPLTSKNRCSTNPDRIEFRAISPFP